MNTADDSTQDPFLQGYQGAYQGYGGPAPNFNRHFASITSPPDEKKNKSNKNASFLSSSSTSNSKLPLPNLGHGWLKLVGCGPLKDINYHLLISKTFYFFFYAAFGSLFPLIAVYFKQIGMNPSQSGMLIGFRPFVEFVSAPFWGNLADKYKIWKPIMLFSLFCWIAFTLGLAFVRPPPHACLTHNTSHVILVPPWSKEAMEIDPESEPDRRRRRSPENLEGYDLTWNVDHNKKVNLRADGGLLGGYGGRIYSEDDDDNTHNYRNFLYSSDLDEVHNGDYLDGDELVANAINNNHGNDNINNDNNISKEPSKVGKSQKMNVKGGQQGLQFESSGEADRSEEVKQYNKPKQDQNPGGRSIAGTYQNTFLSGFTNNDVHPHQQQEGSRSQARFPVQGFMVKKRKRRDAKDAKTAKTSAATTPIPEKKETEDGGKHKKKGNSKSLKDIELESSGELDFSGPRKSLDEYNLANKIRSMSELLPYPKILSYGKSPLPLDHTMIANVDEQDVEGLVSPPFSSIVYKSSDVQRIFWLILFLMMIGEFFSAPAITLVDTATLGYLEDDVESYGKQRMFGSLGWGIAMFIVGISLDQADVFADHPCGYKQPIERNYMVCFAMFTVLMICAFLSATKLKFKDGDGFNKESIKLSHLREMKDKVVGKVKDVYDTHKGGGFGRQRVNSDGRVGEQAATCWDPMKDGDIMDDDKKVQITLDGQGDDMVSDTSPHCQNNTTVVNRPTPFVPRGKPGQAGTLPEWIPVIRHFANVKLGSMLFLTWFMGFGVGLVFTFLFWHLQDLHGTPTLFGIASVINHISEILAYFFSKKLIGKIGHVNVLYLGLLGNVARFIYVSYLRSPWPVLPFELLQGLTHAAVWAACCSYVTQSTPSEYRATAQGLLQGVHHGLGRGCGAVVGGILVYYFGTENVFRGYGITCIIIFVAYFALNYFYIRKYFAPSEQEHDPKHFFEEGAHLAPCGVPMGMNRNLSSNKLEELTKQNGEVKPATTNGFLDTGHLVNEPQQTYTAEDRYDARPEVQEPMYYQEEHEEEEPMDPRTQQGYGYGEDYQARSSRQQQDQGGYAYGGDNNYDPRTQQGYGYGDDLR